ncbi:MAG: NADP-dependent phosphogluconate dehydrogenase [Gammaproteobacteria bacterium]|nr:NADP-dependent phosphogluconate dehydrogenase [Gammaproteobacteria bacterium]
MKQIESMGILGLGVMGRNLAFNLADKGFTVAVYDAWEEARSRFASDQAAQGFSGITLADNPAAFVAALPAPRTILMMIKAGEPVDAAIGQLQPLLQSGDTLIDGGNSHYTDTMRREAALRAKGFYFIGLGVSGGEEGARHGPSLMAGGDPGAYGRVQQMLEAMAASFDGKPCCALLGTDGAGHFVKMVHNGIEYGIMQLIAESYALLRDLGGLDHDGMARVFDGWNRGELASYLVEITAGILRKKDEFSDAPLVEMILDSAGQKGTGRWTSETALSLGIPLPTITESVFARALAAHKAERVAAAGIIPGPARTPSSGQLPGFVDALRDALLGAAVATYAQGLAVIGAASREHGWAVDLATVAAIWRAGCIIRSALLDDIMQACRSDAALPNLMCAPRFAEILARTQRGWRNTVSLAVTHGVPVPALASALAYLDGYRSARLPANLIQAQRDYFGAHTYERTDRPGVFHTQW